MNILAMTQNHFKNIDLTYNISNLVDSDSDLESESDSDSEYESECSDSDNSSFDSTIFSDSNTNEDNEDKEEKNEYTIIEKIKKKNNIDNIKNNQDSVNNNEDSVNNNEDSDNDIDSDSDDDDDNEFKSDSDSDNNSENEILEIDDNDLFNTKTNGNEFYSEVLNNRYLIIKKLGYGSFSSVWMSYDININNLVAIKIINPDDYKEGLLEIKIYETLERINNKYLLTMNECFQVTPIHSKYYTNEYKDKYNKLNDHIVIVLPLLACSAYDLLKCKEYEDGLPLSLSKNIIHQTLQGMKELENNNLIHTDIKPENILICGLNREAEFLLHTIDDINIKLFHDNKFNTIKKTNTNLNDWLISYKIYKEITNIIITFIKNDMTNIKTLMKNCKVSSKYLKNIEIKLCDFNLVLKLDENIGNKNISIQTRYYRAPEIILGAGLHISTDIWSIGCVLFELLTGDLLFNPKRNINVDRDTHHIYLIQTIRGIIPKIILDQSRKYSKIFDNYPLKKSKLSLINIFENDYNNLDLNINIINNIIDFLSITLNVNPEHRANLNILIDKIIHIEDIPMISI